MWTGARQLERGGKGSNVGLRAGAGQEQIAGDSGISLRGLMGGWEGKEMGGGVVPRGLWGRTGGQDGGVNSGWGLLSLRPQLPPREVFRRPLTLPVSSLHYCLLQENCTPAILSSLWGASWEPRCGGREVGGQTPPSEARRETLPEGCPPDSP